MISISQIDGTGWKGGGEHAVTSQPVFHLRHGSQTMTLGASEVSDLKRKIDELDASGVLRKPAQFGAYELDRAAEREAMPREF